MRSHDVDGAGFDVRPGQCAGELDDAVRLQAAQLSRHRQDDSGPADSEHILGRGDLAEEVGRDCANLVAGRLVVTRGGVDDDGMTQSEAVVEPFAETKSREPAPTTLIRTIPLARACSSSRATLNRVTPSSSAICTLDRPSK